MCVYVYMYMCVLKEGKFLVIKMYALLHKNGGIFFLRYLICIALNVYYIIFQQV